MGGPDYGIRSLGRGLAYPFARLVYVLGFYFLISVGKPTMFRPQPPTEYIKTEGKTVVMKFEAEPSQIIEKHTDDRGRLTLGTEYSNQKIKVLILDE